MSKDKMFQEYVDTEIEKKIQLVLEKIRWKIKECEEKTQKAFTDTEGLGKGLEGCKAFGNGLKVDRIDVVALKELHNDICREYNIIELNGKA